MCENISAAIAHSDQRLHCPHGETVHLWLPKCAQWSDCAHRSEDTFSGVAAQSGKLFILASIRNFHHEPSHLDLRCLQKPIIIAYGCERVKPVTSRKLIRVRMTEWLEQPTWIIRSWVRIKRYTAYNCTGFHCTVFFIYTRLSSWCTIRAIVSYVI